MKDGRMRNGTKTEETRISKTVTVGRSVRVFDNLYPAGNRIGGNHLAVNVANSGDDVPEWATSSN